jgi:hypothetical protein
MPNDFLQFVKHTAVGEATCRSGRRRSATAAAALISLSLA